jgi:hypothetical protein
MTDKLPDFKGRLAPSPWSGVKLNDRLEEHLSVAAIRDCKGCGGAGWYGQKPEVQICHCVHRRIKPGI